MLGGKNIIITGANRGIGYKVVENLLSKEYAPRVIFTSRNEQLGHEAIENLKKTCPGAHDRLVYHQLDITKQNSIDTFTRWYKDTYNTVDALINNAGYVDRREWDHSFLLPAEERNNTIGLNFYATINFTETMHPMVAQDGKILILSTNLAQLFHQGEPIRNFLSNPNLTRDELFAKMKEFEELHSQNKHTEAGFTHEVYYVSRAFVNAYVRWVLSKRMIGNQACFAVHPGWIQTRAGGWDDAPQPIDEGPISTLRTLQIKVDDHKKYNGEFFDQKGDLFEF